MFTGLVAELGRVKSLKQEGNSYHLTVASSKLAPLLTIGESIAVNGACLTVVRVKDTEFTADVMPETVRRTVIGTLRIGEAVNLERTLRLQDGLDGHIVTGHVEGVGLISSVRSEGIAKLYTITVPEELTRYIVPKGSVAVDGISLTVTAVTRDSFSISLIPHTMHVTTLRYKTTGAQVNIETDILAKYVEKLLQKQGNSLTKEKLMAYGFV